MFDDLEKINHRPKPFEYYTADELWTDEHTSQQMLACHMNGDVDVSSRNTAFIDQSVDWIISHFDIGEGTQIVDFGCGTGLYTTKLSRQGADITGIDFSSRSIEYARSVADQEHLKISYVNQNYLDFKSVQHFDLAMMIMCDYCALSPTQRRQLLNIFNDILNPGGSVLLDVYSLSAFQQREEAALYELNHLNGFWSPNKYYGFLNTFKYEAEQVVLGKYTIVETNRVRTVYNWLQHFSPDDIEREFVACGFTIERLYADVAGIPFNSESPEFQLLQRGHNQSRIGMATTGSKVRPCIATYWMLIY